MLISKSPLLTLMEAAPIADLHPYSLRRWASFSSLTLVRDEQGRLHVREAELHRWMAERAAVRAQKREKAEQRKREKAERFQRWLASQGLQRCAA